MEKKTGTTIVAIKTKDGVVVASDRRATLGGFIIASKDVKKIYKVSDRIVLAAAGLLSDLQFLVKLLEANIKLRELRIRNKIKVKEAANLLSAILYGNRLLPFLVDVVVAGYDDEGFHIFTLDASGSVIEEEKFYSTGSGSLYAFGVLETEYKEDMNLEEAKELAIKCIKAASERDPGSGNGIELAIITEEGISFENYEFKRELRVKEKPQ